MNRSNVGEVAAACNVVLQFLLARLRQQHEHCTITKVRRAVKVIIVNNHFVRTGMLLCIVLLCAFAVTLDYPIFGMYYWYCVTFKQSERVEAQTTVVGAYVSQLPYYYYYF